MSNAVTKQGFSLAPQSLAEAMEFATLLSKSSIVPKDFAGNPGNIIVAIQWGMELGLQPMQAMQNIAVINGRPALWGDAVIALVRGSSVCEYITETDDGHTATCRVKRKGADEEVRTFSMDDAKQANLLGKAGPWTQYPKRMRQMRARAFALRDVFADVLRGMPIAEEVQDMGERDMGAASREQAPQQQQQKAIQQLPAYPDEKLQENLATWKGLFDAGRSNPEHLILNIQSKNTLTEAQCEAIRKLAAPVATQEAESNE